MSEAAASTAVRAPTPTGPPHSGEGLVCAFNEVRTELVSSLFFLLGNYEDALDAAQAAKAVGGFVAREVADAHGTHPVGVRAVRVRPRLVHRGAPQWFRPKSDKFDCGATPSR